jgi:endonuclease/exonuclease/phosphatase family metal-dependent hydrolase
VVVALIESRLRLVTWNVWGRFGPWERRQAAIAAILAESVPDVVALQEAWSADARDQARELGLPYHEFVGDRQENGAASGHAVLSRWPITSIEYHPLAGTHDRDGSVVRVHIDGPRGTLRLFSVILDWPPNYSHVRQEQVAELVEFIGAEGTDGRTVVCGDFNAPPDSDEIRMLTGRAAGCRVAWNDAWEFAGEGPGHTWSTANPWVPLSPSRRIDFVFVPRMGPRGAGHPVHARLVGTEEIDGVIASDHYGVQADLRY